MADTILFLAHVEDGTLARPALEALGAAVDLRAGIGAALVVGLVGPGAAQAASLVGGCGAVRWLAVEDPAFAVARYATDAAAAEALARAAGATFLVAAGTSRWMRVLPGVAHRLGGRADTHLTSLGASGGSVTATRWYYRQRIEAVQSRGERPWVLVVDPGCHAPWSGQAGDVRAEAVSVELPPDRVRTRSAGTSTETVSAATGPVSPLHGT